MGKLNQEIFSALDLDKKDLKFARSGRGNGILKLPCI